MGSEDCSDCGSTSCTCDGVSATFDLYSGTSSTENVISGFLGAALVVGFGVVVVVVVDVAFLVVLLAVVVVVVVVVVVDVDLDVDVVDGVVDGVFDKIAGFGSKLPPVLFALSLEVPNVWLGTLLASTFELDALSSVVLLFGSGICCTPVFVTPRCFISELSSVFTFESTFKIPPSVNPLVTFFPLFGNISLELVAP